MDKDTLKIEFTLLCSQSVSVTKLVGEFGKRVAGVIDPITVLISSHSSRAPQQAIQHAIFTFVASHRSCAHFHTPDGLLCEIICPLYLRLPIIYPIFDPIFRQSSYQVAELFQVCHGFISPTSPVDWYLTIDLHKTLFTLGG